MLQSTRGSTGASAPMGMIPVSINQGGAGGRGSGHQKSSKINGVEAKLAAKDVPKKTWHVGCRRSARGREGEPEKGPETTGGSLYTRVGSRAGAGTTLHPMEAAQRGRFASSRLCSFR